MPQHSPEAETLADDILKASGSALRHYTMQKSRDEILGVAQSHISQLINLKFQNTTLKALLDVMAPELKNSNQIAGELLAALELALPVIKRNAPSGVHEIATQAIAKARGA